MHASLSFHSKVELSLTGSKLIYLLRYDLYKDIEEKLAKQKGIAFADTYNSWMPFVCSQATPTNDVGELAAAISKSSNISNSN